jgi:DNA primase small subunit
MDNAATSWFYANLFPFDGLCSLFALVGPLEKTEFVAECDEYRKRYITARSSSDLRRALLSHSTIKSIHVGACYDRVPSKGGAMAPDARALVFDIDLDAYFPVYPTADSDDVDANDRAFPVVLMGMRIIQFFLVECFGFEKDDMLLVYSGRRGAHLYVFSPRAVVLQGDSRRAIASWLTIPPPKASSEAGDSVPRLRCSNTFENANFAACYSSVLLPLFQQQALLLPCLGGLGILCSDESVYSFLHILDIRSPQLQSLAGEVIDTPLLAHGPDGVLGYAVHRFKLIEARVTEFANSFTRPATWPLDRLKETIVTHIWPRIDAAVTADMQHTLKSPFVCHPKTGRICVPIFDGKYDASQSIGLHDTERLARELPRLVAKTRRWVGCFKKRHATSGYINNDSMDVEEMVPPPVPMPVPIIMPPPMPEMVRSVLMLDREFFIQMSETGSIQMSSRLLPRCPPRALECDIALIEEQVTERQPEEGVLANNARAAYRRITATGGKRKIGHWNCFQRFVVAVVMPPFAKGAAGVRASALMERMSVRECVHVVTSVAEAEAWMKQNRGVAFLDMAPHVV